jgi:hypothetical protein
LRVLVALVLLQRERTLHGAKMTEPAKSSRLALVLGIVLLAAAIAIPAAMIMSPSRDNGAVHTDSLSAAAPGGGGRPLLP